ncbi:MAG: phosphotransferase, partial [Acidimicrobiales bacterium]
MVRESDPLAEPRPRLSRDEAAQLLHKIYGVSGELRGLHGERDLNFEVLGLKGRRFVLKVCNPTDGPDVIEMRTGAMAQV